MAEAVMENKETNQAFHLTGLFPFPLLPLGLHLARYPGRRGTERAAELKNKNKIKKGDNNQHK